MKKVAVVTAIDTTVRVLLWAQITAMQKQGFKFHVVCSRGPNLEWLSRKGITTYSVRINRHMSPFSDLGARLASIHDAISGKRPLRICHMGTMSILYKSQDVLLEAVSLCRKRGRNIELTLLGEGRYYGYYLDKAEKLGLMEYVNFLGQLPPGKAVIEQLDAADLFVLPSFAEGLPRSLIEAMARGLPCLASNVGGIPELLEDDCLFPPKDAKSLAKKIEALFSDQEKIVKMARRNLQTAQKYRASELNKRREALYQKLKEKTEEWYSKEYQK